MARRGSLFDDLMFVTAKFPWWVGVVLAIVSYLGFHAVATTPDVLIPLTPETAGEITRGRLFKSLATGLQYIFPAAFLFGAIGSLIARLKKKDSAASVDASGEAAGSASCPNCGGPMKLRTARRGESAGGKFYGCVKFPKCRGTRDF